MGFLQIVDAIGETAQTVVGEIAEFLDFGWFQIASGFQQALFCIEHVHFFSFLKKSALHDPPAGGLWTAKGRESESGVRLSGPSALVSLVAIPRATSADGSLSCQSATYWFNVSTNSLL
jgi:hypothetical protein